MTLDLVLQQPAYWLLLVCLLLGAKFLMQVSFVDFRMIAALTLSQFVAHAFVATGYSTITYFCLAFWLCFVITAAVLNARRKPGEMPGTLRADATGTDLRASTLESLWVTAARLFLVGYWAIHLVVLPPNFGVVAVNERLDQAMNAKLLAFATPLVLPALAACMWIWLQRGYRLRWWDIAPLVLSLVGMLGSTSKVNLLPILLAFIGVVGLRRKPLKEMRVGLLLAGLAAAALTVRLVLYFPGGNPGVALQTIAYRFAASTDSIDYLVRGRLDPTTYPYAGPLALLPFITKHLGYDYKFGPGVWLYGEVRGDYSGYGPNPGIVMDYFANLGWFGLLVPIALAAMAFLLARRPGAYSASLLAVVFLAFSDVTLFELALLPQLAALGVLVLAIRLLERSGRLRPLHDLLERTVRPRPTNSSRARHRVRWGFRTRTRPQGQREPERPGNTEDAVEAAPARSLKSGITSR